MKLIYCVIFLNIVINGDSQKFEEEQYRFPPQFQTPKPPILSSDSTIYLPPESSSPIPYFAMNDIKKLPVKFLPPTVAKAPLIYPTPYPMFSSSQRSNFDDEEDKRNDFHIRRSPPHMPQINRNINTTDQNTNSQKVETREIKTLPMLPNYQHRFENMEKVELRKPQVPTGTSIPSSHFLHNQNPASRRMILTSEIQRNDNGQDQIKSASFGSPQYIQPLTPGLFISSTEPAIPILRLSNEMDLDGSFSYEALGADQTHYVQHSRMENTGTDKEEQVVEGSYSYVGDNGQTYTVHYVADSNGYRASGDHLPVPPPIPEIIQRAIQYNLAEEARKPPHLKQNWENDGVDYETETTDHRYSITPLRNLFTGRTPEAFSFGFSQNPQNSLIPLASSPSPVKTVYDITKEQNKPKTNTAPIAPQVTFLASQGAHSPSSHPQQTATRPVTPEKSTMPQLINYDASNKDLEPESNKALWRWQYGLNSNDNQTPNKNTISRSFGEGDDIIINFNEMTPEQYTRMIQSQVMDQNVAASNNIAANSKNLPYESKYTNAYRENGLSTDYTNYLRNSDMPKADSQTLHNVNKNDSPNSITESLNVVSNTDVPNTSVEQQEERTIIIGDKLHQQNSYQQDNNKYIDYQSKIISRHNFLPTDLTITQTYNFENATYEPTKLTTSPQDATSEKINTVFIPKKNEYKSQYNIVWPNIINENVTSDAPIASTFNSKQFSDFIRDEYENSDFKPVTYSTVDYNHIEQHSTTTNTNVESIDELRDNIFLKNLFKKTNEQHSISSKTEHDRVQQSNNFINIEPKVEKVTKLLPYQPKVENEIKFSKKKHLDINDVVNFVAMKNYFEPSKTKPKNKTPYDFNQRELHQSIRYIPAFDKINHEEEVSNKSQNDFRPKDRPHEQSVVKNYKILQRHKNSGQNIDHQFAQESHRNIKTFHGQNLPPLGRAGPSLKSYLPPIYA